MSFLKKIIYCLAIATLGISLISCKQARTDQNTLRVGTIAGHETQLMEAAKKYAKNKYGLNIEIVPFTDYDMPNDALNDGSIDANMFQHQPFLSDAIKSRGYDIVAVGKTFIYPMGIYSKKITHLNQLKDGAVVALPNDPSNETRALVLLEKAGLISLKEHAGKEVKTTDIVDNPKHLKFREAEAPQLPRMLADVDLAAINTNYAMISGLLPSRDALILEQANSPYANLIVVRTKDAADPRVQHLIEALHSDAVKEEAKHLFRGQAIQAW